MERIPVTVLTGFLGAGKTSVLNAVLAQLHGKNVGVIENEFGDIGIDNEIVVGVSEDYLRLANGCICCTVRGDVLRILKDWTEEGRILDHVIIETTGVADPGPIVQTLRMDPGLHDNYVFAGVTTVVDARNFARQLTEAPEVARQLAYADLVVINKIDLAVDVARITQTVTEINPVAKQLQTVAGQVSADRFFVPTATPRGFEASEQLTAAQPFDHANSDVKALSFALLGDLVGPRFYRWVGDILALPGQQLYRMKGLVALAGHPRRILLQVVRDVADARDELEWNEQPRCSKLVLIGRGFDEEEIRSSLMDCVPQENYPC